MRLYQPSPRRPYHTVNTFSPLERIVIIVAVLALVGSVIGYVWQRGRLDKSSANRGGTYVEGIINDSPTKLDRIEKRLTNIGLTYRDADNTIKPALAKTWEVSPDFKTYTFTLRDGYPAEGVLATIQAAKTHWAGIAISAPEPNKVQFMLSEPLNSFLPTTTVQIFPYGPYELIKRDKKDVILRANPQFPLGEPYIEKLQIRTFETLEQLKKAAESGEIDGSADLTGKPSGRWKEYVVDLPKFNLLFFNTTRPVFKNSADRLRVINETDGAPVAYTLVTTQSTASGDLADSLQRALATKNITLNVVKKNSATLQREEISRREFDLLLYGVNLSAWRDYYPFWHSSQVPAPGLNVSGYKNKELDKLLEQARKTNDPAEHARLTQQIEDHLTANGLQKIVSQEKQKFYIKSSIQDVKYGTIDEVSDRFALVWQWHIK